MRPKGVSDMTASAKKISKDEMLNNAWKGRQPMHFIDRKWKGIIRYHYIYQSLLATLTLLAVLLILRFSRVVIIAALGATAFIVFAMPKNITAQPRNVIGGHVVGIIAGSICSLLIYQEALANYLGLDFEILMIVAASISVGLTIFIMVVTDTEHPPGCSTALATIVHGWDIYYVGFIVISVMMIMGVKHLLNPWLKDLV